MKEDSPTSQTGPRLSVELRIANDSMGSCSGAVFQSSRIIVGAFVTAVTVMSGCGGTSPIPSVRPSRPDETPVRATVVVSPNPVTESQREEGESRAQTNSIDLTESNWEELQSLIEEHKGKVVVVDIWSTACEPCMKEFPSLIQLQKSHPDDLVAISFDVDFAGIKNKPASYYRERVLKFLSSQVESRVIHRMCNTPAEDLFDAIKLDSIPAVFVYDREGVLAKRFAGSNGSSEGVSYANQITPFVDDLVKK